LKPTDRTDDLAGMKDWRKAALLYRNAVAIVYQVSALKSSTLTGKKRRALQNKKLRNFTPKAVR